MKTWKDFTDSEIASRIINDRASALSTLRREIMKVERSFEKDFSVILKNRNLINDTFKAISSEVEDQIVELRNFWKTYVPNLEKFGELQPSGEKRDISAALDALKMVWSDEDEVELVPFMD